MSDAGEMTPPQARQRRQWLSWIWIVPLIAAGIVLGLAIRALIDRGPLITISFTDAEGIEAGNTRIRHKDVDLGTVESIYLSRDMSRVLVRARMRRSVADHLTLNARFWIVKPRVGLGGISGLSTIVSGSYIEMYPGSVEQEHQHAFVGLDEPPALTPDTPGRLFTLRTDDLGSLSGGSPVSYRGVPVGEIEGYELDAQGRQLNVYTFVRAPFERYVTSQTRFWNSGGIDVAVGVQGLRFRASSWQQLISGGVSFDTPDSALKTAESPAGTVFRLYDNQYDAQRDPRSETLSYRVTFTGDAGEVGAGTSVQMLGTEIGEVTESQLQYDDAEQSLATRVLLRIDPSHVQITHHRGNVGSDPVSALGARIERLVARGLRAHLVSANLLTGAKIVSLDIVPEAVPARIRKVDGVEELPSTGTTDISSLLTNVQSILHHIDTATAGPALGHAMTELDRTMTQLEHLTTELEPQIKPVMESLRETADAARRTLQAANQVLGTGAASGADLPKLIRELTDSARSLRDLADYLERHPEALLRGRRSDEGSRVPPRSREVSP
jgi:paraquat-inducible protein B